MKLNETSLVTSISVDANQIEPDSVPFRRKDQHTNDAYGIITFASLVPVFFVQIFGIIAYYSYPDEQKLIEKILSEDDTQSISGKSTVDDPIVLIRLEKTPLAELIAASRATLPLIVALLLIQRFLLKERLPRFSCAETTSNYVPSNSKLSVKYLILGLCAVFIGMLIFNFGLTYGLVELGHQVGVLLPATFQQVVDVPNSPSLSYSWGIFFTCLFVWFIGFAATVAEPALQILGEKVEAGGEMKKHMLIYSVAAGVASGLSIGVVIIIFDLELIYFIFGGYAIALTLNFFCSDFLVSVAWDSAGVTTGPVTVPFVLGLGISIASAVGNTNSFGLLTMASVGPIISVLLCNILYRGIGKFFMTFE